MIKGFRQVVFGARALMSRFHTKIICSIAIVCGVAYLGVIYMIKSPPTEPSAADQLANEAPPATAPPAATSASPTTPPALPTEKSTSPTAVVQSPALPEITITKPGAGAMPDLPPNAPDQAAPAPVQPPPIRKIDLPPVRLTASQKQMADAKFVGAAACTECHQEINDTCAKTTHGRAFRHIDLAIEPPDGEFFDERSGRRFRAYRKDNEFRHRESIVDAEGKEIELADYPMRYVVGSGHLTVTYLIERDGFLSESPITWYTSRKAWDFSPGYEKENVSFGRPVYMECLQCHTGKTLSTDGGRGRLRVEAMAIDCERCHGPGSKHIEARSATGADAQTFGESDHTITNPKWLTREQNEDACALCHLQGEAEAMVLGRSTQDFLPGHHLNDFRIDYTAKKSDDSMKIVGHVEQLHHSKCYQASPKMTCVTCHDPHRDPSTFDAVAFYREKCIACHQENSCRLPKEQRLAKSQRDACAHCHMPSSPTDIPHVAAHQHRIGIYPDKESAAAQPEQASEAITLVPIQDVSHLPEEEQQRCLAMAYLALSKKTPNGQLSQQYLERANSLLAPLVQSGLQDPETLAGLAHTYLRREPTAAIRLAMHAFESGQTIEPDSEVKLQFALSDSYLALRQIPQAVPPLKRLTQLRLQAGDWYLLAVCQYNAGDIPQAITTARRAIEIRPEVPNYHVLLAELLTQQGSTDEAAKQRELAKLLGSRSRRP